MYCTQQPINNTYNTLYFSSKTKPEEGKNDETAEYRKRFPMPMPMLHLQRVRILSFSEEPMTAKKRGP